MSEGGPTVPTADKSHLWPGIATAGAAVVGSIGATLAVLHVAGSQAVYSGARGWGASTACCGNVLLLVVAAKLLFSKSVRAKGADLLALAAVLGAGMAAGGQAVLTWKGMLVRAESPYEDPMHLAWSALAATPPVVAAAMVIAWWRSCRGGPSA